MEKSTGSPCWPQIPIRPEIAGSVDEGTVEYVKAEFLEKAAGRLWKNCKNTPDEKGSQWLDGMRPC